MSSAVVESEVEAPVTGLAVLNDPQVDLQIATARRYPRSLTLFMRQAQEMATFSPEIAASCIYALPRKEDGKQKNIEGPSARLAEICASAWGNLRAEGKVTGDDGRFVTASGMAWDLQSNLAIRYEVKRRITTSAGRTYSEDMIGVTGNAAASIALRNAIFKVIPATYWKQIYLACRKVVAGDAKTFTSRRDAMLHEFGVMGVTVERLCSALDVKGKTDITLDHMATLAGFYTALKEGETTIEEAFPDGGGIVKPAERKSQQANGGTQPAATEPAATDGAGQDRSGAEARSRETPSAAAGTVGGSPAPTDVVVSTIVDVITKPGGTLIKLANRAQVATRDQAIIRGAEMLKGTSQRARIETRPPQTAGNAPIAVKLTPIEEGATA